MNAFAWSPNNNQNRSGEKEGTGERGQNEERLKHLPTSESNTRCTAHGKNIGSQNKYLATRSPGAFVCYRFLHRNTSTAAHDSRRFHTATTLRHRQGRTAGLEPHVPTVLCLFIHDGHPVSKGHRDLAPDLLLPKLSRRNLRPSLSGRRPALLGWRPSLVLWLTMKS